MGFAFVAGSSFTLYTQNYSVLGNLAGIVFGIAAGICFIIYGATGKDVIDAIFKKLTGRSFNNVS